MEHGGVVHRDLSFDLLREITNSFSIQLGRGAYGSVYKGEFKDGETIAVKVLHDILGLDDAQFDKEYLNVASLQHKNIVRVVGYCHETRRECVPYNGRMVFAHSTKRALCFEYVQNGCLDEYLSDESSGLDWQKRYQIIKGICEGVKYLHEDLDSPMYHLDLKPANILLDQKLVPKIADFGISRLIGGEKTQVTESVIGTRGYQPPEYINMGQISDKFDIYSLGVVIIKIMTGPMGYFKIAEMSSQEFINLVHANWRNRLLAMSVSKKKGLLAMSTHMLELSSQQVKRCIELTLSCVEANRHKRPCMGVIINKLIETEGMIPTPSALRKDTGSSTDQICSSESSTCTPHLNRLLPYHPNSATVSRAHIVSLFKSTNHRLSDVPENPWILNARTETFIDPYKLTNELTGIWVMKLKTTAELVGLSERELHEQNWELCEEVREKCLEKLLEVAYSFIHAGWSVAQISHQLAIFDALVHVLFNIRHRFSEVAGILDKMVISFKGVMQGTSNDIDIGEESATDPATTVLIQVLDFFSRNREIVQSILESGDCNTDPSSDILNSWVCKLKESAELILFTEKGQRYIFILNNTCYVMQMICRPGSLLPIPVSNLFSLIDQYFVRYLDEYWFPPMLSFLDGDSLKKPCLSSLDKFIEEILIICSSQMAWKVSPALRYILRKEIVDLIVPKYENFLAALQANDSVSWTYWLKGMSRKKSKKRQFSVQILEELIYSLFE